MSGTDIVRGIAALIAAGGDDSSVSAVVIPGAPYSKSRPRFSRNGHTYVKKEDRVAEDRTKILLRPLARNGLWTGNVALACVFYRPDRQRIDVDNMLKHVCDAATGALWTDDSQVTALIGVAELDRTHPRTVVAIGRHVSSLTRGTDAVAICEGCGREYGINGLSNLRRFCTQRCARTALTGADLSAPVPCDACGSPFRRTTTSQRFCSVACGNTIRRLPRPARRADRPCTDCGKQLSKAGYVRCRECWKASRSVGVA